MPRYKIAGVVFDAETRYNYTKKLCADYLYCGNEEPCFSVSVSQKDIDREKEDEEGAKFPDYYLESLSVFRRLCEYVLKTESGMIFHSSAVAVENEAYLFCGPSGAGKSTHARLWRELLGDKTVNVNDDKPIIKLENGEFFVYGTPWTGKHRLGNNVRYKIKAICEIKQAKENKIEKLSFFNAFALVMNQTLRPEKEEDTDKLLKTIEKFLAQVKSYRLYCNVSLDAAKLSFESMSKGE